jgi:hypothetical protein
MTASPPRDEVRKKPSGALLASAHMIAREERVR